MSETIQKKILYSVLFVASIVSANITASKLTYIEIPYFGVIGVTVAFIPFGLALLFSDVLTELYGEKYARSVVNSTIISLIFVYSIIWITILIPSAPFYEYSEEYRQILGSSSSVMVASVIAFGFTQHIDISIFVFIKEKMEYKWSRNIFSTVFSQMIDTVIFVGLAFMVLPYLFIGEPLSLMVFMGLVIGEYIMKFVVAISETPLFYLLTYGDDG